MNNKNNDSILLEQYLELEDILLLLDKQGLSSLSGRQLLRLGQLYRRAVADLSFARTQGLDNNRIQYLNSIVGRSYEYVYHNIRRPFPSIRNFFFFEFPIIFRKNLLYIAIAVLAFLIAALPSGILVLRNPDLASKFVPASNEVIESVTQRHISTKDWMPKEARPLISAEIIGNNVRVSIFAFVGGILFCIPTLFILFQNGLFLGVVGGGIIAKGSHIAAGFYSFVAPHGVFELPAIFIAAGAGLLLGWNLIAPGRYSRKDALKLAGKDAFVLIVGVAVLLLVAGLVEAFFSPTMLPNTLKLFVAFILFVVLIIYLFTGGRHLGDSAL